MARAPSSRHFPSPNPLPMPNGATDVSNQLRRKAAERDLLERLVARDCRLHCLDGNGRGKLHRVAINARADAGEGDRGEPFRGGNLERSAIAGGEQLRRIARAAVPDRPDRVDDVARRQSISLRELRVARLAAAQQAAFMQQLGSRGTVNRAIHAATAQQRRIRRVDDGVDGESRDVGADRAQQGGHVSPVSGTRSAACRGIRTAPD